MVDLHSCLGILFSSSTLCFLLHMHSPHTSPDASDYTITHALFTPSDDLYGKEEKREEAILHLLIDILKIILLCMVNLNNTRPDFSYVVNCDGFLSPLAGLVKIKNEIGTGGGDPAMQDGFSYRESWCMGKVCVCMTLSRW